MGEDSQWELKERKEPPKQHFSFLLMEAEQGQEFYAVSRWVAQTIPACLEQERCWSPETQNEREPGLAVLFHK